MENFIKKVRDTFDNAKIFDSSSDDAIIPINHHIDEKSKVLFVAGNNASGKSLVGKIIETIAADDKIPKRSCSMRNRTSGMFGQRLVFGDESDNSTGQNSVNAVVKGLKSTIETEGSLLILDEPDLGLAENYTAALGEYIASQINEHNEKIGLIVIVSHSKILFNCALETLKCPYSSVFVGDKNITFDDWLKSPLSKSSIDELLDLNRKSRETWKRIQTFLASE